MPCIPLLKQRETEEYQAQITIRNSLLSCSLWQGARNDLKRSCKKMCLLLESLSKRERNL